MPGTVRAFLVNKIFCVVLLVLVLPLHLVGQSSREVESLAPFLESRGLDRLRLRLCEIQLASEQDPKQQAVLANRLARLYQAILITDDWRDVDPELLRRAKQLLQERPSIADQGLAVAIQHVFYADAEQQFREWWYGGREPSQRTAVEALLKKSYRDMAQLEARLKDDVRRAQILPESTPIEIDDKNYYLKISENRILHCQYLLGWNSFFLGIIGGGVSPHFRISEDHFGQFLQLPDNKAPTSEDWLAVVGRSGWHFRSGFGLAMGWRARGAEVKAAQMFTTLFAATDENLRGECVPAGELESLVFAGHWSGALEFVESIDSGNINTGEQILFWELVVRASESIRRSQTDIADRLLRRGLLELARKRYSRPLRDWSNRQAEAVSQSDFLRLWIAGLLAMEQAQEEGGSMDLAYHILQRAVDAADKFDLDVDVARCDFLIASIEFQRGQLAQAADSFFQISRALKQEDPAMASEAAWMNVRALTALAMLDRWKMTEAIGAMDRLLVEFPQSDFVLPVAFERMRLECRWQSPEQAIARLSKIQPSDPSFGQASLERVRNYYRLWQQVFREDPSTSHQAFADLQRSDQALRDDPEMANEFKLRSILWVINAVLKMEVSQKDSAALFDAATRLAATRGVSAELRSQLTFSMMRFAQANDDLETATMRARELADQARGGGLEQAALTYLAESYGDIERLNQSQRTQALADFERLAGLLGDDRQTLIESKNSRIVLYRLCELYIQENQLERADTYLDRLNGLFPDRKDYIAASARLKTQREHFAEALVYWRRLSGGVEPGSALWYETRYQLAYCLWKTGDANAKNVFQQTLLLSPTIPDRWSKQYRSLANQFELDDPQ